MTDQQHRDLLARIDGLSDVVTRLHPRLARVEQQLGIDPASVPRRVDLPAPEDAADAPAAAFIVIGNVTLWHDDLAPYADKYVDVREHAKAWTIRAAGSNRVIATIPKDLPAPKLKTIPPKTNCCSIAPPAEPFANAPAAPERVRCALCARPFDLIGHEAAPPYYCSARCRRQSDDLQAERDQPGQ